MSEEMKNQDDLDLTTDQELEEQVETVESAEVEVEKETEVSTEDQLAIKDQEIAALKDRLHRQMAEFDNFRKRSFKEKEMEYERGAKEVLDKLLPVIDNFERAFLAATDDHKNDPFVQGIDMIYKQVVGMLAEVGVEEIDALGKEFDPNLHHAVQHEESEEHGDNEVADVYQKGYKYKDSVLRYSMVKVVN